VLLKLCREKEKNVKFSLMTKAPKMDKIERLDWNKEEELELFGLVIFA
jgi:hypothetical protein